MSDEEFDDSVIEKMKFSGTLSDIKLFRDICSNISRYGRTTEILLTDDSVSFFNKSSGGTTSLTYKFELPADKLIDNISVNSPTNDYICFDISVDNLIKTLRTLSSASSTVHIYLKTKNHISYINFTSIQILDSNNSVPVTQEVSIQICYPSPFDPPPFGNSVILQMSDMFPSILRACDRFHELSDYLTVSATNSGAFSLESQSSLGNVKSMWTNVTKVSPDSDSQMSDIGDEGKLVSARISSKDFRGAVMFGEIVAKVIVCVRESAGVYVYGFLDPEMKNEYGNFSFYMGNIYQ